MSTLNYIIVEVDTAYNNETELSSGINIVTNTTIESISHINRSARVIEAPEFTILKEGDEVIIHHNICRLRNGVRGELIKSNFNLEGDKYFVPLTEVFMYKNDEHDWQAIDPYCFVEPIEKELKQNIGTIILVGDTSENHKGNVKHMGIMRYPNKQLLDEGIREGDLIIFSKNSEYEFNINGKTMYKMSTKDILGKI